MTSSGPSGRVVVVGSLNVDFVTVVERLPRPGETVSGRGLMRHHGGKGGNQAVAAARMGAEVVFVGAVGRDDFGQAAIDALSEAGVDATKVARVDQPTGAALIMVDASAENMIVVAPGANGDVNATMVMSALVATGLSDQDVVLVSCELPHEAVRCAVEFGRSVGAMTILNPAPAEGLDQSATGCPDILTPNERELATLASTREDVEPGAAATRLIRRGYARWVAVTLGAAGVLLAGPDGSIRQFPARRVDAVDTVGAGDAFSGALAALIAEHRSPDDAMPWAVLAATLSILRAGARAGMPTRAEVDAFGHSEGVPLR